MDIKETKELLKGVELVVVDGIKMVKAPEMGEKITIALELIKKADVVIDAVKGIKLVAEEVKDVDQAELLELGSLAYSLIKAIMVEVKAEAKV